ncbi:hypothetical protein ACFXK0_10620 [Nocardia sp. NPDC059177]|uniref:hypothetical protein n=1 Tax=Nocardia sp. NPDC059177 TaxID=3346759 RepID=UPI0036A0B588
MRFVKTSAVALAFAAVSFAGAGLAQAATSIEVTEDLIGCALEAEASGDTLAELHEGFGTTIELTAGAEADLTAGNCL